MDFLNSSFRVGRIFDITVRVHILFLIWIGFELFQAGGQWGDTLMFLGMLFGIVLIHEFGHCFGARSVGGDAENILMWPLGGLAYAHAPMTPWAQFVTVAAGPAVNVAFCVISGIALLALFGTPDVISLNPLHAIRLDALSSQQLYNATRIWTETSDGLRLHWWVMPLCKFYAVNYLLLAFNLLPIYPLDGGQLFQCLLWPFTGLHQAMTIACQVGLAGCIGLGVWGVSKGGGGMLLFIALFGGFTCWQRLQQLKYGMVVDERVKFAPYKVYKPKREGIFARLFKIKRKPDAGTSAMDRDDQPDDDPWRKRMEEEHRKEAEVDRILKKVRERGIHSLSYVERQTLENATRERQEREKARRG